MKIIHKLDEIVKKMLEDHEGGAVFFDNLDKAVQQKPILYELLDLVKSNTDSKKTYGVIVSGKFGRYFANHVQCGEPFLIVSGGLRKGNPIDDLSCSSIKDTDFIFLDDSFYSGVTRDVIKNELEKNGARLVKTFVIYDGSKEKDDTVHSLYRYYDNH